MKKRCSLIAILLVCVLMAACNSKSPIEKATGASYEQGQIIEEALVNAGIEYETIQKLDDDFDTDYDWYLITNQYEKEYEIALERDVLQLMLVRDADTGEVIPIHIDTASGISPNETPYLGNPYGEEMTLDDVRALAQKGAELTFEDLASFAGGNASSNMNSVLMLYGVKDDYRLIVSGTGKGKPDRADLEHIYANGGSGIDIRYYDVDAFLETGSKIER